MKAKNLPINYKLACVTGASSGIGKALALLLAKQRIPLFITGRNRDELEKVAEKTRVYVPTQIEAADLIDPLQRKKIIEQIKNLGPDLVINNAGFGIYGPTLSTSLEDQKNIIEINGIVPFEISFEISKLWKQEHCSGTIMNVSSVAAEFVFPYSNVYASSKAFITHFSRGLDEELKAEGIRILTSAPGQVDTNFSQRAAKLKKSFNNRSAMTAEFAAGEIWHQIISKKNYYIFDWKYRFAVCLNKFFSFDCISNILKKRIKKRINED